MDMFSLELTKPAVQKPVSKPKKTPKKPKVELREETVKEELPPVTLEYVIQDGDSLTTIARNHNVSIERLWGRNTHLSHQDSLTVGDKLTIPREDEEVTERPFTAPVEAPSPPDDVIPTSAPIIAHSGSGGVNGYTAGYCTWYVKERRPDIGGFWGNANQWVASAQANGYTVGSEPRAGAIGVSFLGAYGHVVYVESVSSGSIVISDMNGVAGFGAVGTRSASPSEFTYIY